MRGLDRSNCELIWPWPGPEASLKQSSDFHFLFCLKRQTDTHKKAKAASVEGDPTRLNWIWFLPSLTRVLGAGLKTLGGPMKTATCHTSFTHSESCHSRVCDSLYEKIIECLCFCVALLVRVFMHKCMFTAEWNRKRQKNVTREKAVKIQGFSNIHEPHNYSWRGISENMCV